MTHDEIRDSRPKHLADSYPPIAVVGMSGRFPGAENAEQLWENVLQGVCSVTEVPSDRSRYWDLGGLTKAGRSVCHWAGFLANIESFDPLFFGISPGEAAVTDPQHRLFLEEAWRAIEDAGYAAEELSKVRSGVFAAVFNNDYQDLLAQVNAVRVKPHELMGNSPSILAGRVAYHLNLTGSAVALDTACSGSIAAVHLACRALQMRELDVALAGGVCLFITKRRAYLSERARMLSSSGAPRPFDDSADGTAPGEAVGVVVLKRLEDAIAAGDAIYGVLVSSGIRQAGKTDGITVPSSRAQLDLFREVSGRGGIDPGSIDYVEAHATGTRLGDPIEFEALNQFMQGVGRQEPCLLGSLKANLGHTTAAAGVAGLIKLLLALKHETIPPQIHFAVPNHQNNFADSPFRINTEAVAWPRRADRPRRAALNGFGFSGTNAHLILEEAPEPVPNRPGATAAGPFWILLSAKTLEALRVKARELDAWLENSGQTPAVADLSYTLAVGRSALEERLAFEANDLGQVRVRLNQFLSGRPDESIWAGRIQSSPPVEGSFPSLGEAWVSGAEINWSGRFAGLDPIRLHLPTYPFSRERYWYDLLDTRRGTSTPATEGAGNALGQRRVENSSLGDNSQPVSEDPGSERGRLSRTVRLKKLEGTPEPWSSGQPGGSVDSGNGSRSSGNGDVSGSLPSGQPLEHLPSSPVRESANTLIRGDDPEEIKNRVRRVVAGILYLKESQVQDDKKFSDLGLDSIVAVDLVKKLNAEFGLNLSSATLYSYPTIGQLAGFMNEREGDDGAARLEVSQAQFTPDLRSEDDQFAISSGRAPISAAPKDETEVRHTDGLFDRPTTSFEPIAIIGVSGRFPGARNLDQFWQNLADGKCFIENAGVRFANPPANLKPNHFWGGFLDGVAEFDAAFFQVAPAEAETMDPQHRLFLQAAWHALEDSGYAPKSLAGKAGGVFVGIASSEYYSEIEEMNGHSLIANAGSGLTGRLAYMLDWTGPSLAVETGCSSSMSAIHLACASLGRRECEFALAGGVYLVASTRQLTASGLTGLLSSSGSCRTFDAAADGWLLAEGVGAILLKRLSDAVRDRDHIHGVIRGSGMQQDGAKNGPTAPRASSQTALQIRVYQQSGIDPETIDYVEAHGLSSRLGDEIELLALTDAFSHFTKRKGFCGIGSVKANIGHALTASGMSSLLKVLLAFRAGKRPPQPQIQQLNENLGFGSGPFFLANELENWPRRDGRPRRAAINGLSATGTNCHLVVDEYLPDDQSLRRLTGTRRHPFLLVLSALDSARLREAAQNLLQFLESSAFERNRAGHNGNADNASGSSTKSIEDDERLRLLDIAFTLQTGRQAMNQRLAWVAASVDEAREKLRSFINNEAGASFSLGSVEQTDGSLALLVSGPEGKQFLSAAYENNSLDKLARLWVAGIDIDWPLLYEGLQPRRVPLPGYPFARTRYWLDQSARSGRPSSLAPVQSLKSGSGLKPNSVREASPVGHVDGRTADNGDRQEENWGAVSEVPPSDEITNLLKKIVASALRMPDAEFDINRDLVRYGFDSLYVLRVIEQLEEILSVRVPAKVFFECRTLRELGQRISKILSVTGHAKPEAKMRPLPPDESQVESGSLSIGQKALWAIQKAHPANTAYHIPFAFYWDGPLDVTILENAWGQVVKRHLALRTVFPFGIDEPIQRIESHSLRAERERLSKGEEGENVERILAVAREPFDLEKGPLWRLHIFSTAAGRNIVLITLHHLIFDGQSLGLVWKELLNCYRQIENGTQIPSAEAAGSYADFVRAEREYLESERSRDDESYWVSRFPAGLSRLGLPDDAESLAHGEVFHAILPKSLTTALRQVAETERVTVQSVFLSAFVALLGDIRGKHTVVTGVAADARPSTDFREVVGFFANLLPISTEINRDESFRVFLHQVFEKLVSAIDHRRFPFSRLIHLLNRQTGDRNELETAFYFQSWRIPEYAALADKLVAGVQQSGEFKLVFEVIEGLENWYLNIKYRPGVFPSQKIQGLASGFQRLLESIVEDPNRTVEGLFRERDLTSDRPAFDYPQDRCVQELIAEQALQTPEKIAVRFGDQQISYGDLDLQSSRLAERLIEAGVRPGGLVGVLMDRSIQMVTALIAIWKAGAAYVPLDPNHPKDRIDYILADARIDLMVVLSSDTWDLAGVPALDLSRGFTKPAAGKCRLPVLNSEARAYVIYTSGSTGNPKGVQISHRGLTHFLWCMAQRPGCGPKDYVLAATTICFDIAALELFLPLITGACVEVLPEAICKSGIRFRQKIESSPATLIQGTPATWRMLLAAGLGSIPRVRALCGGEAWDDKLAEQLLDRTAEVWNMYGPTETTIWSSTKKVGRGQPIGLGEPIGNTEFYIFDEAMRSVRPGETGELYIGGDGLAIGYLNRPELTRERFVPHPSRPEELIYRTGDLVRYV